VSSPLTPRPHDDWDGRRLRRRRLLGLAATAALAGGLAYLFWPVVKEDEAPPPAGAPTPTQPVTEDAHSLVLMPGFDGSYYLTAGVNGVPVLFKVVEYTDHTMLEPRDAERAKIKPESVYESRDVLFAYADVADATVAEMKIGPLTFGKVKVLVRDEAAGVSILGSDVLARFKHWGKRETASGAVAFVLDF
jgi:predicted aspartyl protease